MEIILYVLLAAAAFILLLYAIFSRKKKKVIGNNELPNSYKELLQEHVTFYNELDELKKREFENRVQHFLETTRIEGVNTEVEDLDKVLVAASAIIPIFGFQDWEYMNLNEVMLYPDSFNEAFEQQGGDRSTLGIVGNGPYQNIMILSKHELRQGFINKTGKNNTAIMSLFIWLTKQTER
jgi:Mlc titration factor MtfA (ptsG expression regulator)